MNALTLSAGIAPWWVVMPIAAIAMLATAAHVLSLPGAEMPASRRRIRIANGILIMFTTPVVAYAFAVASPQNHRQFVMCWVLATGLLTLVIFVAIVDVINNWRLHGAGRADITTRIRDAAHRDETGPPTP